MSKSKKRIRKSQQGFNTGSSSLDSILGGIAGTLIPSPLGNYVGSIAERNAQNQGGGLSYEDSLDSFAKLIGDQYGINPEIIKSASLNPLGELFIRDLLEQAAETRAQATGGAGGVDTALGYANLSESARQFDVGTDLARRTTMTQIMADLIATEIGRKGRQAELGGALLGQFMQAIGVAAPKNLKSIPGFQPGGVAERYAQARGVDPKKDATIQAFQNAERTTIPFSELDKKIAAIPSITELEPQIREMIEKYFPASTTPANIPVGGSFGMGGGGTGIGGGGGSAGGGGGGAAAISGSPTHAAGAGPQTVSSGVQKTVSDYLNTPTDAAHQPKQPDKVTFKEYEISMTSAINNTKTSLPIKTIVEWRDWASPETVRSYMNYLNTIINGPSSKYSSTVKSRAKLVRDTLAKKFGETSKTSTSGGSTRGRI